MLFNAFGGEMAEYIYEPAEEYDDDEISLSELFGHIFDRFKMIVIITLIFSVVGVAVALLIPRQYEVSSVIRVKDPYGAGVVSKYGREYFSSSEALYEIFSKTNIEEAMKNTPSDKEMEYKDVIKAVGHGNISGTYNYSINVAKTSETDYYILFINNLVNQIKNKISPTYLKDAQTAKDVVEDRILNYTNNLAGTTDDIEKKSLLDTITNLKEESRALDIYISDLDSSIVWVMEPVKGDDNVGTSKALVCICFFLCGGVIGVILSLVLGFSDKRIYKTETLKKIVDDKTISSIPLYLDANKIDEREFKYIAEKLKLTENDDVVITSLSDKAGKATIQKGLEKETKAKITDLGVIRETPEEYSSIKRAKYTLVVLRAGIDDSIKLEKLIDDLKLIGVKDYGFVLNCIDSTDKNVIKYSCDNNYKKHKWLIETWKSYYKKNY